MLFQLRKNIWLSHADSILIELKPYFQLLVTRPDGSRANNVKVNVKATFQVNGPAWWPTKHFDKDLIVRDGRAKINLPEIPFYPKEMKLEVSILFIFCCTVKKRS